jgi:OOP family OmpA-OmpF porin
MLGVWLAWVGVASAQDGFDARGFHLAALEPDVRDPLSVPRVSGVAQGDLFASGLIEFANAPLVYRVVDPLGAELSQERVLDDLFALNASVGYAPIDRVRVDLALPLVLASRGRDGAQGVGLADARLSATLIAMQDEGPVDLGLVPFVDLPLGARAEFLGQGGLAGGGRLAGSGEAGPLTVSGALGASWAPALDLDNLRSTDRFTTGVAVGYALRPDLGLTVETELGSPFQAASVGGTGATGELIVSGRKVTAPGGFGVAGFAFATTRGASAAEYRLFVGGGWGQNGSLGPGDADEDGITDEVDACPEAAEVVNGFRDGDGCPEQPAILTVSVTEDGQPAPGAKLLVLPADGMPVQTQVGDLDWSTEAFPDTTWRATAERGCRTGTAQVTTDADGAPTVLQVRLAVDRNAALEVAVVDPAGAPVAGATVSFAPRPDGCSPDDGPRAPGSVSVPAGPHTLRATAPGFGEGSVSVEAVAGGTVPARITLAPASASPTGPQRVIITATEIVLGEPIFFEIGQATIRSDSLPILAELAAALRDHPEVTRLEVAGHTDSQGSDAANQSLSQRRAEAVRDALVRQGVEAGRLTARGYGESNPVDTNLTPSGRAKNRRVAFERR